jgi:predicted metal-dependent phosphoesterase TrpH
VIKAPGFVDLHVHTTASDGAFSPAEIVRMALDAGLRAVAITDHDSMEGVDEAVAAAAGSGLAVIPGVEMSADMARGEAHILGYFLDAHNPESAELLAALRRSRRVRAQRMVEKLQALGMSITWDRVEAIAGGGAVGRPHLARALAEAGYVSSISEAFARWIGREGPAYVERYRLKPEEATQKVVQWGGLPVLAHPSYVADLSSLLPPLVRAGLVGLEAYYTGYSPEQTASLLRVARLNGLVGTGGSDFHGPSVVANAVLGGVGVPFSVLEGLQARRAPAGAERRTRALAAV